MIFSPRVPVLSLALTLCIAGGWGSEARAFDAVKMEEVDGGKPYNVPEAAVMDPTYLKGVRVAIVCAHGFEEVELTYPLKHLRDRGATVDIVTPDWIKGRVMAVQFLKPSIWIPVTCNISEAKLDNYQGIIVPGGAWNPIIMRTDGKILDFIKAADARKMMIASLCHGPQVLISAGLVAGKAITGVSDIRDDLRHAGGKVIEDKPVIRTGNLITSRDPNDLKEFSQEIANYLHDRRREKNFHAIYLEE